MCFHELRVALPTDVHLACVMRLHELCEFFARGEFPDERVPQNPERRSVDGARSAVASCIEDDEFLTECFHLELDRLENQSGWRGLAPFHTVPGLGIRLAFGYWGPGTSAGAHEHTAWTITAVCRNELAVSTFDREESLRRQGLVPKNRFAAPAGRVGFIYDPSIHDPCNPTEHWSLTFHASSPRDGLDSPDGESCASFLDASAPRRLGPLGAPVEAVYALRRRHVVWGQIAGHAMAMTVPGAGRLRARCAGLPSPTVRRMLRGRVRELNPPGLERILTVVHPDLQLEDRVVGSTAALGVVTSAGWSEQLRMSRIAREALAFCAGRPRFAVGDIPGRLADDERIAIADALEESGLFHAEVT